MIDSDEPVVQKTETGLRTSYNCPGELYSIPRSIHVARLAAFYSKCHDCEHRFDVPLAAARSDEQRFQTSKSIVTRTSLLTDENVRGVYLNDLDRNRARSWGEALAAVLWDRQPMFARRKPNDSAQIVSETPAGSDPMRGPTVVVGFDERASSPDIVSGLVMGLRRMGCPIIDIGQTSLPIVAFNVHAIDAMAGVFVTGAGCDPSWTGFDFLERHALLFSREALAEMEGYVKAGVGRQTRQIGGHHPQQGFSKYESNLASEFHALRPFRIVCGTSTRLMPRLLDNLIAKLPCKLTYVALPTRKRNLFDPRDADLLSVAQTVVEGQHHLGLIVDEDTQHAAFITDRGSLVTPKEIARLLIEIVQRENHAAKVIATSSLVPDVARWITGRDAKVIDGGESVENALRMQVECDAAMTLSGDGRVWFQREYPTSDALLVFANILQALSLSDASFSEVVARIRNDA